MLRYLISRIVSMVPLLVVITAFTFVIGQYGAGDLAAYLAGTRGDAAKGFDVDRRKILLPDAIKALGDFTVPVRLHRDVTAQLKVTVAKE